MDGLTPCFLLHLRHYPKEVAFIHQHTLTGRSQTTLGTGMPTLAAKGGVERAEQMSFLSLCLQSGIRCEARGRWVPYVFIWVSLVLSHRFSLIAGEKFFNILGKRGSLVSDRSVLLPSLTVPYTRYIVNIKTCKKYLYYCTFMLFSDSLPCKMIGKCVYYRKEKAICVIWREILEVKPWHRVQPTGVPIWERSFASRRNVGDWPMR
jgi:hypothetical protein